MPPERKTVTQRDRDRVRGNSHRDRDRVRGNTERQRQSETETE